MLSKIYFCLFCPQKYNTNDENILRNHLITRHFDTKTDQITGDWIKSLVTYQTELNRCLSLEPKSLPKTLLCESDDNNKEKLLKGCSLCDKIIQTFKLDINFANKRQRNVCICGDGKEVNKIVVHCIQCKHMYHYPCVEPTGYSGEETSLYKCLKCKPKNFEILELSSESQLFQPIHVSLHFNYQPFVCKVSQLINGRRIVCNEPFFRQNFLKTHLKSEHKLTPKEIDISNYYELHSIPKVQNLIDSCFKKLSPNKSNHRSVDQTSAQTSSVGNLRQSIEVDNRMTYKRIRTERDFQTNRESNINSTLSPPPFIEPVSFNFQNNTISTPPELAPATQTSPPILINQSNFNQTNIRNNSQMQPKRGRGRPKGSKSKTNNKSGTNSKKSISPNCYVADSNPQHKSRLSKESRLSRPNISLSREQERALHNKRVKKNVNKTLTNYNTNRGDESSDWDSEAETYEINRRSDEYRIFESSLNQNEGLSVDSNESIIVVEDSQQIRHPSGSLRRSSNEVLSHRDQTNGKTFENAATFENTVPIASTSFSDPTEQIRAETQTSKDQQISCDLQMFSNGSNDQLINDGIPFMVTQITRAEDESLDTTMNHPISSPQNEEPVINQTSNHSDWLTHLKPKKFPYFPQINDDVIYIPYGHYLYIEVVKRMGFYKPGNTTKYIGKDYINKIFFAKVKDIKFQKKSNVRLTKLTLKLMENEMETNQTFNVKFHDIDNVLDFIILKQTYDNSMLRNWKIGDSFRAIIDEKWWFGNIQSYNYNDNCVNTQFQALNIVWGNGTTDILSYWDLEPVIGEIPQNKNISIDVTDEDRNYFYISEVKEWPVCGKAEECKRIVEGLTQVMELNEYKQLIEVLNISNPIYVREVPYLINLSIIRSRVQNMFYRRQAAIKYEIKLLESNVKLGIKFLDPTGEKRVLTNARIVVAVSLKFIDSPYAKTIENIYARVMKEPNNVNNIKYYSCNRPNLNPNPNVLNPLMVNSCAEILSMNILTPSTIRPIINTIRRSNDSEISVIELSDDSQESDEESEQRREEMVDQMEDYPLRPTAPESALPPIQLEVQTMTPTISLPQISRPVVPVRAQPIEERPNVMQKQQTLEAFQRYFCVFCTEKFFDRNEAIDHYSNELKVKLKCSHCPLNFNFESLEQYLNHNSEHKPSFNLKSYSDGMSWIERFINYMDSLSNPIEAQNQIHSEYGDYCVVCQRLNVLTPDSQPLFHKSVFANNRISKKSLVSAEVEFAQHIREHLKYEPKYNCTLCAINKSNNVFTSAVIDDKCRQHLITSHQIAVHSAQAADVASFFGSTKIAAIDSMIPDAINRFIINSSNW